MSGAEQFPNHGSFAPGAAASIAGDARLHGLDAVRAAALLLGIVLHATVSFLPGVDPRFWPVSDSQKSTVLAVAFFAIHVFRMAVFFLAAGFFARLLLAKRGWREFCRNRLQRIALPLVAAWPLCFAALAAVALWAMTRANGGRLPQLTPEMSGAGLNFLHLWFLYLLLWLYALALLARWSVKLLDRHGKLPAAVDRGLQLLRSPLGPLLLAMPAALALYSLPHELSPAVLRTGFGVPTPAYSLVPPLPSLAVYGYMFALGWFLHRQRQLLHHVQAHWLFNVAAGLTAMAVCWYLLSGAASAGQVVIVCYAFALMFSTLGFVGMGLRFFSYPVPLLGYLADASYWMYIAHLPVVMALQTAVMFFDWHWSAKFTLINAAALVVLLVSYRWCVRTTWIGALLNGSKKPRAAACPAAVGTR
jgi:glucans biosynthesis protein C